MYRSNAMADVIEDDLAAVVGLHTSVLPDNIFTFADTGEFLEELLKAVYRPGCDLVCAGLVTPDVEMACHRADLKLTEAVGTSPFSGDLSSALAAVKSEADVVYAANPNRVTGGNFSLAELEQLAKKVPEGCLIVDEYYFDYFGITSLPLLDGHKNVVVLRSFASPHGMYTSDAGFAVAGVRSAELIRESVRLRPVSRTVRRMVCRAATDREGLELHLKETHGEALRVASELTGLGIQCRITATDFLLFRVSSPKDVGNFLASHRVSVENRDGYPQMKGYLRYRLEAPCLNDQFLGAFRTMPVEYFRGEGPGRRALELYRRGSKRAGRSSCSCGGLEAVGANVRKTSPLFVEK